MSDDLEKRIAELPAEKRALLAELVGLARSDRDAVAILGMACRFPGGADTPERFWKVLTEGVDTISEVPADRWDIDRYYDPDPSAPGKMSTRFGSFLERVDGFDAPFFGVAPREAARMDPQQRLLLEVSWEALENAGQSADRLAGSESGVFVGLSTNDYWWLQIPDIHGFDGHAGLGGAHCVASGRLSHVLDLRGPNVAVDTACSSSLFAVHLACQSLLHRECDLALAGGVNVMVSPVTTVFLSKWGVLAPDGRSKPFDASADGFARGEGCGIVVLKRLADALAEGDPVLAVIRGSAANHDGHASRLSAPNGRAQEAVIRKALENARVAPSRITFVEAHGTGTSLGDPIEVEALSAVLGQPRPEGISCALGSVKANIGHLEAAAGVASLMKVVLCLQHGSIPRQIHFRRLNPRISLESTPFFIPERSTPWEPTEAGRYAGINSFGLSGTNVHLTVGEAPRSDPPPRPETNGKRACLLPLSGRSASALDQTIERYRSWLDEPEAAAVTLEDICHTAGQRRAHHPYRAAMVARTKGELAERLGARIEERAGDAPIFTSSRPLAFLFSGQGSQWVGMGRELLASDPVFRESLERSDALLRKLGGWSLLAELAADEPRSRLDATEVAQPAIFAIQAALLARYRDWGILPDAVVGHSVGEIAAAHAAGALSLEEAVRVAFHRGRIMQRVTGKGRMAAVGLSSAETEAALRAHGYRLALAAINGPESTVVSGEAEAVGGFVRSLKESRVFAKDLGVDYAFHSEQMEPLVEELAGALRDLAPSTLAMRFLSTVTGTAVAGTDLDSRHWGRSIREPVRFADAIGALLDDGYDLFVEIGPSPVLASPVSDCLRARGRKGTVLAAIQKDRDEERSLVASLGSLYTAGRGPDWSRMHREGRYVRLPNYPWQHRRYWIPEVDDAGAGSEPGNRIVSAYYDRVAEITTGNEGERYLTFAPFPEPCPGFSWLRAFHEPDEHPEEVLRLEAAQKEMRRVLFRGIDFASIRTALDFGCGYGSDLLSLGLVHDHLRLHGFTISAKQAKIANDKLRARGLQDRASVFHRNSATDEFPDRYDLVFGFEVAHYVEHKHDLFANIDRHLNDGGFVILADFVANTVSEIRHEATSSFIITADQWAQLLAAYKLRIAEYVDASAEVANFLWDPRGEENLRELSSRFGNEAALRAHYASYDGLGRLFRKKLATYALLTIQKDRFLTRDALENGNRKKLAAPTPYSQIGDQGGVPIPSPTERAPEWVYGVEWRRQDLDRSLAASAREAGRFLILADAGGVGQSLAERLRERGSSAVLVSLEDLERAVADSRLPWNGVVHLCGLDAAPGDSSIESDALRNVTSLLHTAQAMSDAPRSASPARLWVVTRGAQPGGGSAVTALSQAPLWGLGRTIAAEQPALWGGLVDLDPEEASSTAALRILELLVAGDREDQIAFRGGIRYVPRLVPRPYRLGRSRPVFRADASYLVTGGLGGLGLQVAKRMVDQGARHLVLLQRSELPSGKAIDAVKALEGAGAQVHLLAANVADSGELDRKLGALLPSLPPLRGVVHAAGILDDGILLQMSEERFANVMAPKLGGAANLHRLTRELPLDFFVVFSSVAGLLGSPGQGNYGAANAGLDALAHYRRGIGLPALSLDWGPWAKVGMAAADERRGERVGQHGIGSIPPERGVVLFQSLLEAEEAQLAVVPVDVPKLIASWPEAARQPLLAELTRAMRDPAGAAASVDTAAHEEPSAVRDAFEAAEPAERRRVLSEYVTREMARVLQLAPAELDMRRPLNTLGIDSLMAVELRNRLESDLPVRVQIASLLEGSSPDDLVNKLLSQLPGGAQPPADRITAAVRTVRELSDEEVRALLAEKKKEAERRRSTEGS